MFTVRSLSACEVPPHLANVLRNVYLRKPIDFVLERICLRILVPRIVIVVMLLHSVIGPHYTVDSSDVYGAATGSKMSRRNSGSS